MILLIDNYDSFSYNLYQLIGMIRPDIRVIRNDEMTIAEIEALAPDHIIVSPDRADQRRPESVRKSLITSKGRFQYSGCVSDIRQSARHSAARSDMRRS